MKILFITDRCDPLGDVGSLKLGGINIYSLNLPYYLSKLGISIDVFTPAYHPSKKLVYQVNNNLRYIRIIEGPTPNFKENILKFIRKHNLKYDLIHSNFWFAGQAAIGIASELRLPQIHIYHTHGKLREKILQKFNLEKTEPLLKTRIYTESLLANKANLVIATSKIEAGLLKKNYSVPNHKIKIIPIGVDTTLFKPVATKLARKSLGLDADNPIILFVGRMEFNKGPETLLDAFKILKIKHPTAVVCFVGGNNDIKNDTAIKLMKTRCKNLGIAKNVRFFGRIDQNMLNLYYSAADVCVMPTFYEIFGIVPIESMACGTPVVGSDTGGLKYTIINGVTGYRAQTQNTDDFAEKINLVLKQGKDKFAQNCTNWVEKNFLWKKIAVEYKIAYLDVFANKQSHVYPIEPSKSPTYQITPFTPTILKNR